MTIVRRPIVRGDPADVEVTAALCMVLTGGATASPAQVCERLCREGLVAACVPHHRQPASRSRGKPLANYAAETSFLISAIRLVHRSGRSESVAEGRAAVDRVLALGSAARHRLHHQ